MTAPPAVGAAATALAVRSVCVTLGGVRVLDEISLDVNQGEWVTVIGPNGAGKSTLLKAVGGLVRYSGSIEVLGTSVAASPRRELARRVAGVAQNPVIPPGMAVLDYVLLGRTPYLRPLAHLSRTDLDVVWDVLDRLDLARLADRLLETLSGGERQRAFLARALAQGARLLLLDEPTAALDIGHQQEVLDLVESLRVDTGLTVLATMHDLSVAGEYAARLVLLDRGRVVATGTPGEVLTEELIRSHYGARVRILAGEHGPLVVAVRTGA